MIPLADVQREILGAVAPLAPITVPVRDALGLVTTRDVIVGEAVPPFANTAMDGYAVRAADTAGAGPEAPVRLAVAGELPAGRAPERPVGEGEAIRIMTGAPIPKGADTVVKVEDTENTPTTAKVFKEEQKGANIRLQAEDVRKGDCIIPKGKAIRSRAQPQPNIPIRSRSSCSCACCAPPLRRSPSRR